MYIRLTTQQKIDRIERLLNHSNHILSPLGIRYNKTRLATLKAELDMQPKK